MCDGCAEVGAAIARRAAEVARRTQLIDCSTCEGFGDVLLTDVDLVPCPTCYPDAYGAAVALLYPTEEARATI